jgi:hypothetical protein
LFILITLAFNKFLCELPKHHQQNAKFAMLVFLASNESKQHMHFAVVNSVTNNQTGLTILFSQIRKYLVCNVYFYSYILREVTQLTLFCNFNI